MQKDFHLANKEISPGKVYMVQNCFTLGFQFMASEVTGRYERLVDLDVFLGETAEIQVSKKREKEINNQKFCFQPFSTLLSVYSTSKFAKRFLTHALASKKPEKDK